MFSHYDLLWPIENRKSKIDLSKQFFFLKTQCFYDGINILDSLALMTKQFTAYFVQKFKCKDEVGCKGFING